MGSGKSALIITTLAGAILDPLVEIDIYCMAHNADYDPFRPIARTLHVSDDPDALPTVLDSLTTLLSELSQRGRKLSAAGEPKLTRRLAAADPTMRPRVVVIDECQELFLSDIGEQAAELVTKIVAKGRKYGVTLLFATPVPSAESLPRAVAKVQSNRACFAIGDHHGNDAILGTGKHTAGITATSLRPATTNPDGSLDPGDIGTAMTTGFTTHDGLIRCYHIPRGDGVDQLTPIIERALTLRHDTGLGTGLDTSTATPAQRHQHSDTTGTTSGPPRRPAPRHGRPHPDAHPGSTRRARRPRPRPLPGLDLRPPHRRTPHHRTPLQIRRRHGPQHPPHPRRPHPPPHRTHHRTHHRQ
nr:hypothetical protein [Pseudonocardia sp. Ae717_Ps2]